MRITYNAPATLTFALLSALVLLLNTAFGRNLIPALFTAPGGPRCPVAFNFREPLDYARLLLHVFGHADWNHLVSNLAFILLLGPVIEERYGSPIVVLMMTVTSLVTGVLNACFSPTQLVGSSDIAFMMILLASFTSITKNEIPLSFLLILALYVGRELVGRPISQNIATFAHIAGGLCGSLFAFLATPRRRAAEKKAAAPAAAERSGRKTEQAEPSRRGGFRRAEKPSDSDATVVGTLEL
ncbi:MAG: rhomboid family intramembrane serine protease [Treponemataceae bacterium]|nr:rhomboid family intramembrane serine protease [Treponemataceae bacterium]